MENVPSSAIQPFLKQALEQVLKCYTAKTALELKTIHAKTYAPTAQFIDPFVVANGQREALLQFYSLQKLFSSINVKLTSEPRVDPAHEGRPQKISIDCAIDYTWKEGGLMSRLTSSDTTPVECTVELEVSEDTQEVLVHTDVWNSPKVPHLPMALRTFNCMFTNSIFRLLGWEKELDNACGKNE